MEMSPAVAGLLGAATGAIASLLGSMISNWLLLRKDREQWLRTREAERENWLREQLQTIYSNCLDYLSRLSRRSKLTAEGDAILVQEHQRELFTDFAEAQKWLALLLVYHPQRGQKGFDTFRDYVRDFSKGEMPDDGKARILRLLIIDWAANDLGYGVKQLAVAQRHNKSLDASGGSAFLN